MLSDFLNIKTPKDKLKIALKVIQKFKSYESHEEWLLNSFESWYMLEKLEEYFDILTKEE